MTLSVDVVSAFPLPQSAAPGIGFRLRIEETSGSCVHAIALRCHTRIEPRSRHYTAEERGRLYELFGHRSQWDRTLRGVTWSQSSLVVPTFTGQIEIDLHVPCTYDLEVASAKYFHAIRDGEVPLVFLFSGTMFNAGDAGLRVEPVPWDLEASFRMPAQLWTTAMDQFFPGGGWLRQAGPLALSIFAASANPAPNMAAYAASKSAVEGLSDVLAMELSRSCVRVMSVHPGVIDTPIVHNAKSVSPNLSRTQIEGLQAYYTREGCHPSVVAKAIVEGIRAEQSKIFVGPSARTSALLRRFAPTTVKRRLTLKLSEKIGFWHSPPEKKGSAGPVIGT